MKKTPYDFCYVYQDGEVVTLDKFLFDEKMRPEFCGLSPVPHFSDSYCIFFDHSARTGYPPKGYQGICDNDKILISQIPKGAYAVEIMSFDRSEFEKQKYHEI